jgi:protein HOOK3
VDRLNAFYEEMIGMQLNDAAKPSLRDLSMRGDHKQLAIVLRLILGAAVNCETRQTYIQNIVQLDLIVQQRLMEAIQELMQGEPRDKTVDKMAIPPSAAMFDSLNFEQAQKELQTQLSEALDQLRSVQKRYETLQEKNFELEQALNEEYRKRKQLSSENEQLNDRIGLLESTRVDDRSEDHRLQDQHVQRLQTRMDQLERELMQTEMQREECLLRVDLLEKELSCAHANNEQLMRKVKEAEMLKDELDVHRHSADKIANYEQKLEAYKQKLEELLDQRKQFKAIEDKNQQLLTSNSKLERDVKSANALKVQVGEYKKQVQELHQQVIEKTHQCDKSDFEVHKMNEQLSILLNEKERLIKEKMELKSRLTETLPVAGNFSLEEELEDLPDDNLVGKMHPNLGFEITSEKGAKLKEQIERLEQENRWLREKLEHEDSDELLLLRTNCEDSKVRVHELETNNRNLNKKIIELESLVNQLNEMKMAADHRSDRHAAQLEHSRQDNELGEKVQQLQETVERLNQELIGKQEEINEIEAKYRLYIDRAKKAVNVLEPLSLNIQNGSSAGSMLGNLLSVGNYSMGMQSPSAAVADSNALGAEDLRAVLSSKDAQLVESEKQKAFLEFENRLMTTAFHKFAFDLQRRAATQRVQGPIASAFPTESPSSLSKAPSSNSLGSGGSSLLNKHRQATTRKFNIDRLTNV